MPRRVDPLGFDVRHLRGVRRDVVVGSSKTLRRTRWATTGTPENEELTTKIKVLWGQFVAAQNGTREPEEQRNLFILWTQQRDVYCNEFLDKDFERAVRADDTLISLHHFVPPHLHEPKQKILDEHRLKQGKDTWRMESHNTVPNVNPDVTEYGEEIVYRNEIGEMQLLLHPSGLAHYVVLGTNGVWIRLMREPPNWSDRLGWKDGKGLRHQVPRSPVVPPLILEPEEFHPRPVLLDEDLPEPEQFKSEQVQYEDDDAMELD